MRVVVSGDSEEMARQASKEAAEAIRAALAERGQARIIIATGASQFGFLQGLTAAEGIDWSRVTAFHLDEYVGLSAAHPASFRNYLRKRFVGALPAPRPGWRRSRPRHCRRQR